ncbi:MAG: hypothetical protein ACI4KL_01465 [Lentihominibacter sp.]
MTLLITIFAAVIATVIWYTNEKSRDLKISALCFMYWGAALMWMIDAVFEYVEQGAEFFAPAGADMINDGFLGFSVLALGMIIWLVILLVSDPRGTVKAVIKK